MEVDICNGSKSIYSPNFGNGCFCIHCVEDDGCLHLHLLLLKMPNKIQ